MTQEFSEFQNKIIELDDSIKDYYKKFETPTRKLILDGIVNIEEYYDSPIKILWMLKEPYDKGNGEGGGWSIVEDLDKSRSRGSKKDQSGLWSKIIYTSYGILNQFCDFTKMKQVPTNDVRNVLRQIAYINVQKLPATSKSNNSIIQKAYEQHKSIILSQINAFDPDIIIGGMTTHLLRNDKMSINKSENKKFVSAYHPAYWGKRQEDYVNDIVISVKEWHQNKTK